MENDSPNGILVDSLCMAVGAIAGALINQGVYKNYIPQIFDYLNGVAIFVMLVVLVIFAIKKIKNLPHTPRHYMLAMTLLGWYIGTFIIVEINAKSGKFS